MQENHFPPGLVPLRLPGVGRARRSAPERARKGSGVEPALGWDAARSSFPFLPPVWRFLLLVYTPCRCRDKNRQSLRYQPEKANSDPAARVPAGLGS